MSIEGFKAAPIETFGGRVTIQENQLETPPGYAADELNCDFLPGRVFKRPGLTSMATLSPGSAIAMDEYVTLTGGRRILIMDNRGALKKEDGTFTISTLDNLLYQAFPPVMPGMISAPLFGRQFLAFSEGWQDGHLAPRHYDDTNLDRVSQSGPGEGPSITDGGAGGSSGAGVYLCRVFFVTRSGYFTSLSPPSLQLTLAPNHKFNVANIPIGPDNVVKRILAFTPVNNSVDFYYISGSAMEIADNTTTTVTGIDFSDTALLAGTPASSTINTDEDQLRQIVLPPQAGVIAYKERLAWWGGRNELTLNGDMGLRNLSFDGGFTGNRPLGWSETAAGESKSSGGGGVNDVLKLTGDGVNQRGRIQNKSAVLGWLPQGKTIKIRARMQLDPSALPGSGTIHFFWTGTGAPAADMTVNVTDLSASEWRLIEGQVLAAADNKPVKDWAFNITSGGAGYGGSPLTNAKSVLIDDIAFFASDEPVNHSLVRWSKVDDPEAYDGLTGIMNVAENNGQEIRASFVIRDNVYFVKERSMFMTRDNGSTEPNEWTVEEISASVGTLSPRGVAVGDGWAVIAGRAGVYMFAGGIPFPISNEIRPDWARVNWLYGHLIWVKVDVEAKRLYVGVPLDNATEISHIFYCRYDAGAPGPTNSYTQASGSERNWSLWTGTDDNQNPLGFKCALFSERSDGTRLFLMGLFSGDLAKLDATAKNDLTFPINSFYKTAPIGASSGRNLIGYLTMNVRGTGALALSAVSPVGFVKTLPSVILEDPFDRDVEQILNISGERYHFRFGTNAGDTFWSMQKFVPYLNSKVGSPIRGYRG